MKMHDQNADLNPIDLLWKDGMIGEMRPTGSRKPSRMVSEESTNELLVCKKRFWTVDDASQSRDMTITVHRYIIVTWRGSRETREKDGDQSDLTDVKPPLLNFPPECRASWNNILIRRAGGEKWCRSRLQVPPQEIGNRLIIHFRWKMLSIWRTFWETIVRIRLRKGQKEFVKRTVKRLFFFFCT